MSWKDFFYFEKRDRSAIISLLLLIVIAGSAYIFTTPSTVILESDKAADKGNKSDSLYSETGKKYADKGYAKTNTSRGKYPYQEKLKIGETVELNTADTTDLKKIPGIGSSYAGRIVKYRHLLGGYAWVGQLREVYGMDEDLYKKITPYIKLVTPPSRIRINSADFEELNKHPYIDYRQAKVITDIRTRKGHIESVERLLLLDEFTEADIKRLTPYLLFQ